MVMTEAPIDQAWVLGVFYQKPFGQGGRVELGIGPNAYQT